MRFSFPHAKLNNDWDFRIVPADDGFHIITNLEFEILNREYQKYSSKDHSPLTPEFLLLQMYNAHIDIKLAAQYASELVTSPVLSSIINFRFQSLFERRRINSEQISIFQDIHLDDARAIREAINSGERKFGDFLPILERATTFKSWVQSQNPDAKLLKAYYKEVTSEAWINTLPVKIVRYIVTSIAGVVNPGVGLTIGALDTFLLDRVARGWRPNQFVEGPLKRFVGPH